MSTRKIKDAKDLETGEKIYLKGHARATYMSDGRSVEDSMGDKADKVEVVNHGTSDSTFALTPNKYHRWGTMASLTLTLASPNDTSVVNNYAFEFTSGSTATTLLVPSSIQWVNDITVEAGKRYQGIINSGIGVLVSVTNE